MNVTSEEKVLATGDSEAAAEMPQSPQVFAPDPEVPAVGDGPADVRSEGGQLAPLFSPDATQTFRAQWDGVQISFVDDPQQAVRKADELVAQVMKSLAESFSVERGRLESQMDQTAQASTENLRVALRRYRSFFQRLLSV